MIEDVADILPAPQFAWVRVHNPFGENWIAKVTDISAFVRETDSAGNTHWIQGNWKHCHGNMANEKNAGFSCTPLKATELLKLKRKGFIA